jgi:ribosomal protein S18 acetylase RimI-like enzyme
MNGSATIRPATEADISAMSQLLSQLFSIETDFVPDEERQRRGLELLLGTPGALVIVAEDQSEVIGMATVQVLVSTAEGGQVGLVEDVVVDINHRDRGVGAALLDHLQKWAQDQGLSRLQLAADSWNSAALGFYARNGWEQTSLVILRFGGK